MKGFARGGIIIHCKSHRHQHFCKGNSTGCLTSSDIRLLQFKHAVWDHQIFVLSNLTLDDNGTYYCVEDGELHTEFQLHIEEGKDFILRFEVSVNCYLLYLNSLSNLFVKK